jgi:glycosyltransferase involved in cell wall biosynthesis
LLSSYNGSKFLRAQLDSLYRQTYPAIKILVRDDGSSDGTLELLQHEQSKGLIELVEEKKNLGATNSFFELLRLSALTDTAFIAFCDQDDVWFSDKIECAVSALADFADIPALYCSRLQIVDQNLNHKGFTQIPRQTGFGNALVENIAVGCTTVLNRKAVDLICRQLPVNGFFHDWWCYLVISCLGKVVFDDSVHIYYRQHGNNTVGAAMTNFEAITRKTMRLLCSRLGANEQADVFLEVFNDKIPLHHRNLLDVLSKTRTSFWSRILLSMSRQLWRQKFIDNLMLRFVILFNRL